MTAGASDSAFDPDGICSRAQTVTFLWRAAGEPEPAADVNPFTDVDSGEYYYDAVLWAVENGITVGTSDTTFSPADTVTRAQAMTFLHRFNDTPEVSGSNPFTDVDSSEYYYDAVLWAVERGITVGTSDTTFGPEDPCTRAHIVAFLYRNLAE